jgi:AsmA protein
MNKTLSSTLKTAGSVAAALIVIIVAAIALLPSLINTSTFKESLIQQVKARTGQALTIEGDLSLSVFPWLGIKTGKVTLSQSPDISDQDLLQVERANIGVKLLPLLQKTIEVGQITLEAPRLHFVVNQEGRNSLDSFLDEAPTTKTSETEIKAMTQEKNTTENKAEAYNKEFPSSNPSAITISGIKIINGHLTYEDKQKNERHIVNDVYVETGNLLSSTDTPIILSAQVTAHNSELIFITVDANANIDINTGLISANAINANIANKDKATLLKASIESLLFDQKKQIIKTKSISLALNTKGFSPQVSIPFTDINLKEYSTSAIEFLISEPKSKIEASGDIALKHWDNNPMIKGQIKTNEVDPSKIIDFFKIDYKPSDTNAFKKLYLSTHFSGSSGGVSLHSIKVILDDSRLAGDISIINFENPSYRFDLSLDTIDLDRYLSKTENESNSKNAGLAIAIPIPLFKKLTANGIFRANTAQANGAKLNDIRIGIASKNQQVIITSTAKLYEGDTKGTITFTENIEQSTLTIKNKLNNVNIGPLLRDTEITDQVSGKATIKIDLNILDKNGSQTNNGITELLIKNGALKGVDFKKILDDTQFAFDKLRGKASDMPLESQSIAADETRFAEMTATLNLNNNVLTNKNLLIKAPAFRVRGKGKIELEGKKIDYLASIAIVNTNSGQGGEDRDNLKNAIIPVHFYGNVSEPKYKIDTRALIKENTKKEANKKKAELKEELKQKDLEKLGLTYKKNKASVGDQSTKQKLKDDLKKKLLDELFK